MIGIRPTPRSSELVVLLVFVVPVDPVDPVEPVADAAVRCAVVRGAAPSDPVAWDMVSPA
ncbi:hypothetical protein GCM10009591_34590 [Brachybacterium tyrofermentans]